MLAKLWVARPALAAVVGAALGLVVPTSVGAGPLPYPVVLAARATPDALPLGGGRVLVTGTVENAASCQLRLLSRQSFPVVYSHNPTSACSDGSFFAFVTIGANPSPVQRTVAFALVAGNGPFVSTGRFFIAVAPRQAPVVLLAHATPAALTAAGGEVIVTGAVDHAASCQLRLLSRQSFPVVYSHNATTACSGGSFSAHVTIGANPSPVKRTVAFALVARNGPFSFIGRFYVPLAPRLVPAVLSAQAVPDALGQSGGQVIVTGAVEHAASCQLRLLSRQSFPVVYAHNATTACSGGSFSAHVTIGANPSPVKRTVAFALVARNGPFAFSGPFYVSLAASTKPTSTAPPPPPGTAAVDPYPAGSTGYDVSWPQCAKRGSALTKALPPTSSFAAVGVNDGTIGGFNSCFAAEAAWAGRDLSVYIILQPAPGGTPVTYEATGPEASCAATSSECEGYDWGYNYARADIAFVGAQGLSPRTWWLDIETAEGWPTAQMFQPVNAAIVQGALAAIKQAGDVGGIYCTWYQWGRITGSYVPSGSTPIWVAGAGPLSGGYYSARSYCARALSPGDPSSLASASIGFAGAVPWLVQYGYGGGSPTPIDSDYSCA
jgi:hypothetical protein